jgi:hypothetical protein
MKKLLLLLCTTIPLCSCHQFRRNSSIAADSVVKNELPAGRPADRTGLDTADDTPSQSEEREGIKAGYDRIQQLDTIWNVDGRSMRVHLTYYCLKDSTIMVPQSYEDNKVPFRTHPFSSIVTMMDGGDTLLNRRFLASDFEDHFVDNFGGALKEFGSIKMPRFARKRLKEGEIAVDYPLVIPSTDIGKGMFLILSRNGKFKIVDPDSSLLH